MTHLESILKQRAQRLLIKEEKAAQKQQLENKINELKNN